jgi:hypothetical protein
VVEILFCQYENVVLYGVSLISAASLASVLRNLRKMSEVAQKISMANVLIKSTPTA